MVVTPVMKPVSLNRGDVLAMGGGLYKVTRVVSDREFEVRRTFGTWMRDWWRLVTFWVVRMLIRGRR